MIDFQFHNPTSLDEVFSLLDTYGDDARMMAGGTALVIQMKQRLVLPEHVINLRRVPGFAEIRQTSNGSGGLTIGALCTQQEVATSPLVEQTIPIVAQTYRHVATPRIRHMATVGGGLVHGDPSQDPPPTLITLGATVTLVSANGQREVALSDFLLDYYETDVRPGEVLTQVSIPAVPSGAGAAYLKFLPRTADDYPTVAAAAVVTPGEGNVCQDVRLALGAVGTTAIHATDAEDALRGQPLTENNIRAAAALVKDLVDPLDDYRGSADYKRDMSEVFARRAIQSALTNAS